MKVSGNIIYLAKKYIIDKYGPEKFNGVLKHVDEKAAKVLSGSIISTSMYDIDIDLQLIKALELVFGKEIHKVLGEYKVKSQITGFYGIVIKFVSIKTITSQSQKMWNKTYSEGRLTISYDKDTKFTCTISEAEFAGEEYYMYTILYYLKSFIEAILGKKVSAIMKIINSTVTEMIFIIEKN